MKLFLRLFANCDSDAEAVEISKRLSAALTEWNGLTPSAPRRYWKMPDLFEFTYNFVPGNVATFEAITNLASDGWTHYGRDDERSSVWNRAADKVLLVPEVVWAELQLYEFNDPVRG